MLLAGAPAPDFRLPDETGAERSLADLSAGRPLVLYFYPGDFTPVCTREACMFRDSHADLEAAGIRLAGISAQDVDSHRRFKEMFRLPFPLLADPKKKVIRAYDVLGLLGLMAQRVTYLLEPAPDGMRIADAVRAELGMTKHEAFARRAIERTTRL